MIYFSKPKSTLSGFGPSVNIDKFLSDHECSKIISLMSDRKLVPALVSEVGVKNTSIRSTELCSLDYNQNNNWIFSKLEEAITQVNESVYKYELHGFHEAIQLMKYKPGAFYGWHSDFGNLQFSRRKLSFSVQLTDASEYEGGDLEFFRNGTAPKIKGTLVIFPSFFYHQVLPVTNGVRRALVGWVDGPPYK